ncbi:ABC transporter permease subunit [Intestinibacter sp.]
MINYIKSELYRNLRCKGNYIFTLGCVAFVLFLNIALAAFVHQDPNFPYANTYFSFTSLYLNMTIPMLLCVPMVAIIFAQEYKNHTLKNTISFGVARKNVYFGKFLMTIIIGLINIIVVVGIYVISANLLLEDSGATYFNELIRAVFACTPLFLVAATLAHSLYFIFESENTALILWIVIMIIIPKIMSLLGGKIRIFKDLASIMPWNVINKVTEGSKTHEFILYWTSQQGLINCFIIGIVGSIIIYFIGLKIFEKVEIK